MNELKRLLVRVNYHQHTKQTHCILCIQRRVVSSYPAAMAKFVSTFFYMDKSIVRSFLGKFCQF
jgi:hypothetical protein